MKEPLVIEVNEKDEVIGFLPKLEAHEKGALHRAVSVVLFNSKGEWMVQQRALDKYHSGGLWSNTCCSHPYPNETVKAAAERRLYEEMGIKMELEKLFVFQYKAALDHGLTEHEIDHVFIGITDELPVLNFEEVASYRYMTTHEIQVGFDTDGKNYTEWFKILYPKVLDALEEQTLKSEYLLSKAV